MGGSWASLGQPWAALGRPWGGLGRILGAPGTLLGRHIERSDFRSILSSILVPKRMPKGRHLGAPREPIARQNGRLNRVEFSIAKKSRPGGSFCRYGVVWGRRGGGVFIDFLLVFVLFHRNRPCRSCKPSKSHLGATKVAKWPQLGGQEGGKIDEKSYRKRYRFLNRLSNVFEGF